LFGYLGTLIFAFMPIAGDLSKSKVKAIVFKIRLDHLLHFGAYLLICLYYLAGKLFGYRLFETKSLLKFLIIVLLLAIVTEGVQLWVPERKFNPFELLTNVSGIAVGSIFVLLEEARRSPKGETSE